MVSGCAWGHCFDDPMGGGDPLHAAANRLAAAILHKMAMFYSAAFPWAAAIPMNRGNTATTP